MIMLRISGSILQLEVLQNSGKSPFTDWSGILITISYVWEARIRTKDILFLEIMKGGNMSLVLNRLQLAIAWYKYEIQAMLIILIGESRKLCWRQSWTDWPPTSCFLSFYGKLIGSFLVRQACSENCARGCTTSINEP